MHVNETAFDLNLKMSALSTTTLYTSKVFNFDFVVQTRMLNHK